ncbi:MAG: ElyC/SanA/YdcF family protein, partial [Rubrobacter sp.]
MTVPLPVGELGELVRVYRGRAPIRARGEGRPRVAVVLGAQVLRSGRPSPTLEARTRHAGELYAAGGVDLLIPTGGEGEHPPSEADVMATILLK